MLHAFTEYLKYMWRAKGRHGTHSPFVYDLVEQVLQDKGVIDKAYRIVDPALPLRYENLLSRIAQHYKYKEIVRVPAKNNAGAGPADMLLMDEARPGEWMTLLDEHYALLHSNSAVIVKDIHKSVLHTAAWNKLRQDERVRMSIDLYGMGMLLFRKEFKVRQSFVLKY